MVSVGLGLAGFRCAKVLVRKVRLSKRGAASRGNLFPNVLL